MDFETAKKTVDYISANYAVDDRKPLKIQFTGGEPLLNLAMDNDLQREIYCYALSGKSFAVMPNGDVYPCSSFGGMESFKLGNISDRDFNYKNAIEGFEEKCNVLHYGSCKTCSDKDICGGACIARSVLFKEKQSYGPYSCDCELKKFYIHRIKSGS